MSYQRNQFYAVFLAQYCCVDNRLEGKTFGEVRVKDSDPCGLGQDRRDVWPMRVATMSDEDGPSLSTVVVEYGWETAPRRFLVRTRPAWLLLCWVRTATQHSSNGNARSCELERLASAHKDIDQNSTVISHSSAFTLPSALTRLYFYPAYSMATLHASCRRPSHPYTPCSITATGSEAHALCPTDTACLAPADRQFAIPRPLLTM